MARRAETREPEGQWESWETCEIQSEKIGPSLLTTHFRFVARRKGPQENQRVAESSTFPATLGYPVPVDASDPRAQNALRTVIQQLLAHGWKPLPPGDFWFSYRFYRHKK
jgi:hypothetical protein